MTRRTFTNTGLAAMAAPACGLSREQQPARSVPGYQIADINGGRLTTGYGGMATSQAPVDNDTLFQVASCAKTVTALAVMTLVRDGRIDLDLPVNRYLERWQLAGPRGETATAADLMSHTAGTTVHGFAGYGPDEDIPDLMDILSGRAPANSAAVRTRQRLFRRFRYSGGGTTVLQALIEDVTGIGFANYTLFEVLEPIGAGRATFAITPDAAFAHGSFEDGQPVPGGFMRHPESAAAGLWATAIDLVKVLGAITCSLRDECNAILPSGLARRMVTPVSGQSALGVFVGEDASIFHDGRNFGFDSTMAADLRTGRIKAAVTNRNGAVGRMSEALIAD
ncbi:serine hydrolase domain-containing protein [Tateyamaria omphalii]|uniref:serine hydrolase domain-containing protein n=1 Tax=Tateyamaria omphalii TaxID=299262 RepID=UPI001677E912|nr:serine hydrolase domain-containing protein [Tateyamaria omphalii]